jgi:hypothetical protein
MSQPMYEKKDYSIRTQIGMFRPIRMDHTNCLQVAIKTLQSSISDFFYFTENKHRLSSMFVLFV